MIIQTRQPHELSCRCEDCTEWVHSHHEAGGGQAEVFIDWKCAFCIPFPGEVFPEPVIMTETCWTCNTKQEFTGRERVIEAHRDPTATYELACGHWVI